jgi:hypothetical protein
MEMGPGWTRPHLDVADDQAEEEPRGPFQRLVLRPKLSPAVKPSDGLEPSTTPRGVGSTDET